MPESEDGALISQAANTRIEPRKLTVQRGVVQGLFHGRVRQGEPLLHEVDAQQRLHGKGRTARLACGGVGLDLSNELCPWDHKIHLIKELALACPLGGELEPTGAKAALIHLWSTFKQRARWTYAECPLGNTLSDSSRQLIQVGVK